MEISRLCRCCWRGFSSSGCRTGGCWPGVLPFVPEDFAVMAPIAFFPEIVTVFSGQY